MDCKENILNEIKEYVISELDIKNIKYSRSISTIDIELNDNIYKLLQHNNISYLEIAPFKLLNNQLVAYHQLNSYYCLQSF